MTTWPPALPDHQILERWRPIHRADLEELLASARLQPCEAIECVARSRESGARELITALRDPALAEAAAAVSAREKPARSEDVDKAIQRAREAHRGRRARSRRAR